MLMAASSAWGAKATTRSRTDNLLGDKRPRRGLAEAGEGRRLSVLMTTGDRGGRKKGQGEENMRPRRSP